MSDYQQNIRLWYVPSVYRKKNFVIEDYENFLDTYKVGTKLTFTSDIPFIPKNETRFPVSEAFLNYSVSLFDNQGAWCFSARLIRAHDEIRLFDMAASRVFNEYDSFLITPHNNLFLFLRIIDQCGIFYTIFYFFKWQTREFFTLFFKIAWKFSQRA